PPPPPAPYPSTSAAVVPPAAEAVWMLSSLIVNFFFLLRVARTREGTHACELSHASLGPVGQFRASTAFITLARAPDRPPLLHERALVSRPGTPATARPTGTPRGRAPRCRRSPC